ncbi:30S ribosomal protein S16 [Botrimarina sp.]|uniref:30S ribosomal protein S16 n=1 Tax=Botrimarina sp. TaxID=2795802 RepID=UPI0032EB1892
MAVRIRMKKMGRAHRHFFRICATDKRSPRDGRVLEELGTYDPMLPEADARAVLNKERVSYWLGVGAQPSEKVAVLIKKYGENGTHLDAQRAALEKLSMPVEIPDAGEPVSTQKSEEEKAEEPKAEEAKAEESAGDGAAADQAPKEESTEEAKAE